MARSDPHPLPAPVVPLLTLAGGFVDAAGYLAYFHIFVANMTGNNVRVGIGIVQGDLREIGLRLAPIVAFALGVMAGEFLSPRERPARSRHLMRLWAAEALLLAVPALAGAAAAGGGGDKSLRTVALMALLAAAMGVQNTSVRRARNMSIHTTFVTGTLMNACIRLADAVRVRRDAGKRGRTLRQSGWLFLLLLAYTAGAMGGAAAEIHWGARALVAPILLLAGLIGWRSISPGAAGG